MKTKITPVANWRYFYRKWSFWLIGAIPFISALQLFLPDVQYLFPDKTFLFLKGFLAIAGFIASQIKQQAIAVPPNPPEPEDKP